MSVAGAAGTAYLVRSLDELARLVTDAAAGRSRIVVGIAGSPGSGKSTIAGALLARLGGGAALLPMDGFHLANVQLVRLGIRDRKGAPDTFDAAGFAACLGRIRAAGGDGHGTASAVSADDATDDRDTVYAPEFHRDIDESVAGAIAIPPDTRIVVVEGNYLLLESHGWDGVAGMLDLSFFVSIDHKLRVSRLVARHERFGMTHAAAVAWAGGTDERNAVLIEATRHRADHVLDLE